MHSRWTNLDTGIVLILVLTTVLSWLPRMRGPIDLRWDAAVYYLLGTSLADNLSYRLASEPGNIQTAIYPPLLPLLVATHQWILGTADPVVVGGWLRGTFGVFLGAYFITSYLLLRTRLPVGLAVIAMVFCTLDWHPHWLSDRCYSDLPFAVAAAAFFVFSSPRVSRGTAGGVCAVLAYLLRSAGIALLVAWVAERLLARDWRRGMKRLLLASIPVVAWQGYVFSLEHSDAYRRPAYSYQRAPYNIYNVTYSSLATLRDHRHPHLGEATGSERVIRIFRNAAMLPIAFGGSVSARRAIWEAQMERIKASGRVRHFLPWAAIPVAMGVLGVLVLLGFARQAYEGEVVVPVALLVYAGTVCVMPTSYMYELPRYLAVFTPVAAIGLMKGVDVMQAGLPRFLRTITPSLLFSSIIVLQTVGLAELYRYDCCEAEYSDWQGHHVRYRLFTYDQRSLAHDRAITRLNLRAPRDAIVVSSLPHWVYLRTGLRTIMPPMESEAERVSSLLDAVPASYVLIEEGSSTGEYVAPVIRQLPDQWQRVPSDTGDEFELFERRSR